MNKKELQAFLRRDFSLFLERSFPKLSTCITGTLRLLLMRSNNAEAEN
jgi:hypothetical protein